MDANDFIAKLKRARKAIERGQTGCQNNETWSRWCIRCALVNHGNANGDLFWRWKGPDADWSKGRTKDEALALIDASIADMRKPLHQQDSSKG